MTGKPFRPPLLKKVNKPLVLDDLNIEEHQVKKRRFSTKQEDDQRPAGHQLIFKKPGISSLPRKPLLAVTNSAISTPNSQPLDSGVECYYSVLWYIIKVALRLGTCSTLIRSVQAEIYHQEA